MVTKTKTGERTVPETGSAVCGTSASPPSFPSRPPVKEHQEAAARVVSGPKHGDLLEKTVARSFQQGLSQQPAGVVLLSARPQARRRGFFLTDQKSILRVPHPPGFGPSPNRNPEPWFPEVRLQGSRVSPKLVVMKRALSAPAFRRFAIWVDRGTRSTGACCRPGHAASRRPLRGVPA